MNVDTGNFHVFFPNGCYRKNPTSRRKEILVALDNLIQSEHFDMGLFYEAKQAFSDSGNQQEAQEALLKLSALVRPLFIQMLKQGFSREELQSPEGQA